MVHNHDPVTGRVYIELDRIGAGVERGLESRKRILGVSVTNAAVCNDFRCAQFSLGAGADDS
jgi:hypothetical protein